MSGQRDGPTEAPVAILFTDVEGSTALGSRLGDEAAHELLQRHREAVRRRVTEHGGREVKQLGDGLMVVFASSRRALESAVAIQQDAAQRHAADGLRVRIGVHCGEAIESGGDLFGTAVNVAARIMAKAAGGETLVSDVVRQLAGSQQGVAFRDRGRFRLKGVEDRWRLYEVISRDGSPAAVAPGVAPERTPFVGRESERAVLEASMRRAAAGEGSVVFVGGEPGVGKTRLAEEVGELAAAAGFRVRIGHCYESEGTPPYVPFVEILESAMRDVDPQVFRSALGDSAPEVARIVPELRRLFPDIRAPMELPAEQERHHLFNSVCDFIVRAAAIRPQLLVLDDLHWGDESTLLLLERLAERVRGIPALVIGTFRDTELDVARPLSHTLVSLTRRRLVTRLTLSRLDEAGVAAMLTRLVGQLPPPAVLAEIYRETEGNAFFVEEVFRYLVEAGRLLDEQGRFRDDVSVSELDVPDTVRMVVGHRLERLHEATRTVLTAAAVAGRRFDPRLLGALDLVDDDALLDAIDEAERARLIVASGAGDDVDFHFAHELIRQTMLTGVAQPRRQRLHLLLARALETIHADSAEQRAAEIAHHLMRAGTSADSRATVRFLGMAGRRALGAAAFAEALRHFDAALEIGAQDELGTAELLVGRGMALRSLGRWEETIAVWGQALDIREKAGDVEAVGSLSLDLAGHLAWAFRFADAWVVADRGLRALGEQVSTDRCRLLAFSGVSLGLGGFFEPSSFQFEAADRIATELGDVDAAADVAGLRALASWSSSQALDLVEQGTYAAELLEASDSVWNLAQLLGFLGFGLLLRLRLTEAETLCRERLPFIERLGFMGPKLLVTRIGMCAAMLLRPDATRLLEQARRDEEAADRLGLGWAADSLVWQGTAHLYLGDLHAARAALERAPTLAVGGPWMGAYDGFLIHLLARTGGREEALERMAEARRLLPTPGTPNTIGAWALAACMAEAAGLMGEVAWADELYPLVIAALDTGSLIRGHDSRMLQPVAGLAAGTCDRWDEAEEHFQAALRVCDESGNRLEVPFIHELRGRVAARHRDPAAARRLLDEAARGYAVIGLHHHAAAAAAEAAKV